MVIVASTNGCTVAFPANLAQGLDSADLAAIEILGNGNGLRWPTLDVDLAIPDLTAGLLRTRSRVARQAGRVTSEGKARAAARTTPRADDRGKRQKAKGASRFPVVPLCRPWVINCRSGAFHPFQSGRAGPNYNHSPRKTCLVEIMTSLQSERDVLVILTRSIRRDINHWELGCKASEISGKTIHELIEKVCCDRFAFASKMLAAASVLARSRPPHHISSISRSYYAMYHAARAVAFHGYRGDDHQEHSKLPGSLPTDLPDREKWENELKSARLARNNADYDPYGDGLGETKIRSRQMITTAQEFLDVCRSFLETKGVVL